MTGAQDGSARVAAGWVSVAIAVAGLCWTFTANAGLAWPAPVVAIASTVPLYLVARGWRLPWWLHLGAAALPLSLVLVAVAHGAPDGLSRAARYAYGAMLLLGVAAWARRTQRRALLAGAAGVVATIELAGGLATLARSGDPGQFLFGNSWPNQFAFTELAAVAIGLAVAALGRWTLSPAGLGTATGALGAVAGIAGVVLSGSRTGLAGLAIAGAATLVLAVIVRGWRGLALWSGLAAAGVLVVVLVRLPLLLAPPSGPAPAGGTSPAVVGALTRGSLDLSWVTRLDYWRAAIGMGAEHPFVGAGLGRYGDPGAYADRLYLATDPHDEWLLGWAEGGIIGLIPLVALLIGVLWLAVRAVPALRSRIRVAADPARWGALLALLALIGHIALDFDWRYAALVGLAGLLGGVAAAPVVRPGTSRVAGIVNGVLAALTTAAGAAAFLVDPHAANQLAAVVG